jgi:type 1 glutamine amidotransferase
VLGKEKLRDLMTFLLAPPIEPAKLEIPGAPPPRTWAEVQAVIGKTEARAAPASPKKTLKITLAAGPKDHGPGEHDYPLWQRRWVQLLGRAEGVEVDTAFGWPDQKHFDAADVIVFFSNNPGWSKEKAPQLDVYLKRGGGLIYLHYAVDGHDAVPELAERIGLAWKGGASKFRHGALDLKIEDRAHPIMRGFDKSVKFIDESYWQAVGDPSKIHLLATGVEEGAPQPLVWTFEPPGTKGRVFVNILGHYNWTFDDPLFRVMLLRAVAWCGRDEDVERLTPLATVGARMEHPTVR